MDDKEKKRIERMLEYLIEDCSDHEGKLTTWEMDFIESVDAQFRAKGTLSPKQIEVLDRIYHK